MGFPFPRVSKFYEFGAFDLCPDFIKVGFTQANLGRHSFINLARHSRLL